MIKLVIFYCPCFVLKTILKFLFQMDYFFYCIDDLKKLEETIKKVEDNNIYNGFNINEHKKNVESLREFYSYWSIHAEKV